MNMLHRRGFTLIELLVVIAIIGILAAVVLASLSDAREQAKNRKAQADMRNILTSMEVLFHNTGWYPHKQNTYCPPRIANGNEVDLSLPSSGLVATDGTYIDWTGPYVNAVTDPWGNPYFFDEDYYCTAGADGCNGFSSAALDHSVLVSCGPDGMLGDADGGGPIPNNGTACAYNDDNVVLVLCRS